MSKIKICGLYRNVDIEAVNAAKPDYCGFILHFPKSHRCISEEKAAELKSKLDPEIKAVGVFVNQPIDIVLNLLKNDTIDIAQLHGDESPEYIKELQQRSEKPVWKAFKVRNEADLAKADISPADMLVLDNGKGTGKTFNWSILEGFERDYFLAGGMGPENIPEAIEKLNPFGIDLSSGVETEKLKDKSKIMAAVKAVRIRE